MPAYWFWDGICPQMLLDRFLLAVRRGIVFGELVLGAPGGVEPPTNGLGNRCSIQLSYGAVAMHFIISRCFRGRAYTESRVKCSHTVLSELGSNLAGLSVQAQCRRNALRQVGGV
jgi:hypothetical protein